MAKLWGGAFEKETDREVEIFTASIGLDERLWEVDIVGSIAHARMLGKQGIIPKDESERIIQTLGEIREEIRARLARGETVFDPKAEDIHSEIEKFLTEKLGPIAGKLHTARSRNDQVVTDVRLYLRGEVEDLKTELRAIQSWLVDTAEKHLTTVLPGLTHTQHAQPVSLAHHLMAYFWMFERDHSRLVDQQKRLNRMPLGSAAMAGTSFPLDRAQTAQELGFDGPTENSLDAVSDRDFVIEYLAAAATLMSHLSRLAEELIYWSTPEFGFVRLDDSVTTGSSIMPQKKNPDVAELIRGRVGRVYGALMGALTMLKSLPLAYNRDLQEDKHFLFEGVDTTKSCLRLMTLQLKTATFRADKMAEKLHADFSNATDLADYLVTKNLPFRQAHEVAGKTVRLCMERGCGIEDLTLADLKTLSPLFEGDVIAKLKPVAVMEARTSEGGTGVAPVKAQIAKARAALKT